MTKIGFLKIKLFEKNRLVFPMPAIATENKMLLRFSFRRISRSSPKKEIIESIQKHQITIFHHRSETGSGKTTQIPKMCLAAGLGLAGHDRFYSAQAYCGNQYCPSHRPFGIEWGVRTVRRLQNPVWRKKLRRAFIKVATTTCLRKTVRTVDLLAYDTLIVDEAHERSLNIDLFGLPAHPARKT